VGCVDNGIPLLRGKALDRFVGIAPPSMGQAMTNTSQTQHTNDQRHITYPQPYVPIDNRDTQTKQVTPPKGGTPTTTNNPHQP